MWNRFVFSFAFLFLLAAVSFSAPLKRRTSRLIRTRTDSRSLDGAQTNFNGRKATVHYPYTPIGIDYLGGPVYDNGANIYITWYGSWSQTQKSVIRNFIQSLGNQSSDVERSVKRWWKVNENYYNNQGKYLSTNIELSGEIEDNYSLGKNLSSPYGPGIYYEDNIAALLMRKLSFKLLPKGKNQIFLVLTSADVIVYGLCSYFCGYHWYFTDGSTTFYYALVGNAEVQCPGCFSGNIADGARGMIDSIAHELAETLTDPDGQSSWLNSTDFFEDADLCTSSYGAAKMATDGTMYNLIGNNGFKYLVQELFNPKLGFCVDQEPYTPPKKTPSPFTPIGISYRGGKVLDKGVNVYLIWIGSWSTTQKQVITGFVNALGSEAAKNSVWEWWKTTSLYFNAKGQFLSPNVTLKGEYNGRATGPVVLFSDFYSEMAFAESSGKLERDPNGVYVVLTARNIIVTEPVSNVSLCDLCSVHEYYKGVNMVWVGNTAKFCPRNCTTGNSVNGDIGVDSMISYMAAQLTSAATDPLGGFGWYDYYFGENANQCTGSFGTAYGKPGKQYNLVGLKGMKYLVQQNWNPKTGQCVSHP